MKHIVQQLPTNLNRMAPKKRKTRETKHQANPWLFIHVIPTKEFPHIGAPEQLISPKVVSISVLNWLRNFWIQKTYSPYYVPSYVVRLFFTTNMYIYIYIWTTILSGMMVYASQKDNLSNQNMGL